MKTSDNGSLFILDETLKLMEGKIQKRNERERERERESGRGENEKVMSEAHTSIYNFPFSSTKHQAVRGYVVQFLQTQALTAAAAP
jgi:hypothetical protein